MCFLSICITTYNQSDLLRDNINQIIKYRGDDIEIVVSDNCSTEDIKALVDSYDDSRIKYYRTQRNVGHDGNILFGLSKCIGKYVYLFRTRDTIIGDNIPKVIDYIKEFSDASFFLFSALDENGEVKMVLKDKVCRKGAKAIKLNGHIISHPSGMIYRTADLKLQKVEEYINSLFKDNLGFISHDMIQMILSLKGDFVTSKIFGWNYANTNKANDVSGNVDGKSKNIYDPKYIIRRFRCLYRFAYNELPTPYNSVYCRQLVRKYFKYVVIAYPLWLKDKDFLQHYKIENTQYNRVKSYCDLRRVVLEEIDRMRKSDQKKIEIALGVTSIKIPYWILRSQLGVLLRRFKLFK